VKLPARASAESTTQRRWPMSTLPLPPDLIALTGLDVRDPDADLGRLQVRPIAPEERTGWRLYLGRYHYLGDRPIVGEHQLYAALLDGELVAPARETATFGRLLREPHLGEKDERDCGTGQSTSVAVLAVALRIALCRKAVELNRLVPERKASVLGRSSVHVKAVSSVRLDRRKWGGAGAGLGLLDPV
jgi:hypothetical protein